jgi:hypothetical protein
LAINFVVNVMGGMRCWSQTIRLSKEPRPDGAHRLPFFCLEHVSVNTP